MVGGQIFSALLSPARSHRSGSRVRKSAPAAAVEAASATPGVVRSLPASEVCSPRQAVGATSAQWIVMSEAPASPAPVRLRAPLRSPSPCLNLDTLSSDGSAGPGDVSDHPICISDVSCHSGDPDQVLSEDDLPPEVREPEVHVVDLPPEVRIIDLPPEFWIIYLPPGVHAVDLTPDDRVVDLPPEGRVEASSTVMPQGSARISPCSPLVVSLDQSVVSSMVISPQIVYAWTSLQIFRTQNLCLRCHQIIRDF